MGSSEFYVDFNIEVPNITDDLVKEAERKLHELVSGHNDIIGAAVSLEKVVKTATPYLYKVRIVLYKRPHYLTVTETQADPVAALRGALDAIETRVQKSREKLRERAIPNTGKTNTVVYDLTANEVYGTYAKGTRPSQILEEGRERIASRLMLNEGLTEEAAYFAADQILRVATERMDGES